MPLLRDLLDSVETTKWFRLGLELNISEHSLNIISDDASGVEDRLRLLFQKWLKVCEKPSWRAVVNALVAIKEEALAAKLKHRFCVPSI